MDRKQIEITATDHAMIKHWAKLNNQPIWLIVARMTSACMNTDISYPDKERDGDAP